MYQSFQHMILKNKILNIILWLILLFTLLRIVLYGMNTLPFSPDSWSYWELSKTIFSGDFYKIHGWRQFQTLEPYSMSFPLLWPLIISLFGKINFLGPAIMPLLAGISFLIGVIVLEKTFKKYFNIKYLGLLGGFLLLSYLDFVSEITAGRSIPLAFMLISSMLYIWFKPSNYLNVVGLGTISGLLILSRFDMVPFVILFGIAIYIKEYINNPRKKSFKYIFIFYFIIILTISPYINYSLIHFDKIFATDNSLVSISAYEIYVADYFFTPIATVFDEPLQWIKRIGGNFIKLIFVLKYIIFISAFGIVILYFLFQFKKMTNEIKLLVIFLFVYIFGLSSYILTGYYDKRYFSVLIVLVAILNVVSLKQLMQEFRIFAFLIPSIVIVLGFSLILPSKIVVFGYYFLLPYHPYGSSIHFKPMTEKVKVVKEKLDKISLCSKTLARNSKIMFSNPTNPLLIASYLKIDTTLVPSNFKSLTQQEKLIFLKTYNIKAYYGNKPEIFNVLDTIELIACRYDEKYQYIKEK